MKKRTCLVCGDELRGRADQRFCGNYCRSVHHNRQIRNDKRILSAVHRRLSFNRKLLLSWTRSGRRSGHLSELILLGFEPELCTGCDADGTRHCYELRYRLQQGYIRELRTEQTNRFPQVAEKIS